MSATNLQYSRQESPAIADKPARCFRKRHANKYLRTTRIHYVVRIGNSTR